MKFGTLMQIGPLQGQIIKVLNLKKQDGGGR